MSEVTGLVIGSSARADVTEAPAATALDAYGGERGMVSAEWAVGIIAAVAIAGVLLAVVTNGRVEDALLDFILSVIRGFAS